MNTRQKAQDFVEDLKTSWYFRVWFFFWLVCFLAAFSSLIILGERSTEALQHEGWTFWWERDTTIEYPSFAFRTAQDEVTNVLGNVYCQYNSLLIPTADCDDGTPRAKCVQLNMDGDFASRDNNNLICSFAFNVSTDADKVVGFEIVKAGEFGIAFTWMNPNNNVWILLTKNILKFKDGNEKVMWGRQLVYHSSVTTTSSFQVSVLMDHFHVAHWVESDYYNGWMCFGDVGGVAFFLVVLHTISMAIVGIFLDNNSKFLNGGGGSEFQPIK